MAWWGWLLASGLLALQAWRGVYLWGCAAAAGAMVMAVTWVFPRIDLAAQLGVWATFSVIHVALWSRRRRPTELPPLLLGRTGQLTTALPAFHRGTVMLDRAINGERCWSCLCASDLAPGSQVEVIELGPGWLKVAPLPTERSHTIDPVR